MRHIARRNLHKHAKCHPATASGNCGAIPLNRCRGWQGVASAGTDHIELNRVDTSNCTHAQSERTGANKTSGNGNNGPGMAADCIALDLTEPNLLPMYNEVSHIVYAATGMETRMTMVGGEVLYQDGHFTRFDYPALRQEMRNVRRFVLESSGS